MSNGVRFLNENDDIKKIRDEGYVVIGVHNGIFHCDDVSACCILDILLEKVYNKTKPQETKKIAIVRTRNPKVLKDCSVCVDIGGGKLDHHYEGCDKKRENGIRYASIGLVWKIYGKKLIELINPELNDEEKEQLFKEIDDKIIKFIDADDNGQPIEKPGTANNPNLDDNEKFFLSFDFDFITLYNPSWHEKNPDFDNCFERAFSITRNTFGNCLESIVLNNEKKEEYIFENENEQKQFVEMIATKYQASVLKNFTEEPNVMRIYKNDEDIRNTIFKSGSEDEKLKEYVNQNIKDFLEQHSFRFNLNEDKKGILEQKIRQIVDEFYATKIIEYLTQDPENIKDNCLIIPAQTMPWKKGICEYNKNHKDKPIRFVMYPYPNGGWALECVPESTTVKDRYSKLTPLLSNIPASLKEKIKFVHKNKFFARTNEDLNDDDAKDVLYDLAKKSVRDQNLLKYISRYQDTK